VHLSCHLQSEVVLITVSSLHPLIRQGYHIIESKERSTSLLFENIPVKGQDLQHGLRGKCGSGKHRGRQI
jgi:hypothetical protein